MGIDTPNVLSRETAFLMGILKRSYPVEKVPIKQNNHIPIPISDQAGQLPSMEEAFSHSVPSMEGVFSHSVAPVEGNPLCHSVLLMEEKSQMNCASISEMAPITIHFQLQIAYIDVFQGIGKFPGDPYKFRLKPDAVPAIHRPRKVPVHLQEAFHEEVDLQ